MSRKEEIGIIIKNILSEINLKLNYSSGVQDKADFVIRMGKELEKYKNEFESLNN